MSTPAEDLARAEHRERVERMRSKLHAVVIEELAEIERISEMVLELRRQGFEQATDEQILEVGARLKIEHPLEAMKLLRATPKVLDAAMCALCDELVLVYGTAISGFGLGRDKVIQHVGANVFGRLGIPVVAAQIERAPGSEPIKH